MERFQYVLVIDENTTIEDLQATLMQAFLLRLIAVAYEVIFTFNSSVKQINFAFSDVQIRFSSLFFGPQPSYSRQDISPATVIRFFCFSISFFCSKSFSVSSAALFTCFRKLLIFLIHLCFYLLLFPFPFFKCSLKANFADAPSGICPSQFNRNFLISDVTSVWCDTLYISSFLMLSIKLMFSVLCSNFIWKRWDFLGWGPDLAMGKQCWVINV